MVSLKGCGRQKLLCCQRVILLGSLNLSRTVPTEALQVLMWVPSLDLKVIRCGMAYRYQKGLPLQYESWIEDIKLDNPINTNVRVLPGNAVTTH